jgi:hypothetical protein
MIKLLVLLEALYLVNGQNTYPIPDVVYDHTFDGGALSTYWWSEEPRVEYVCYPEGIPDVSACPELTAQTKSEWLSAGQDYWGSESLVAWDRPCQPDGDDAGYEFRVMIEDFTPSDQDLNDPGNPPIASVSVGMGDPFAVGGICLWWAADGQLNCGGNDVWITGQPEYRVIPWERDVRTNVDGGTGFRELWTEPFYVRCTFKWGTGLLRCQLEEEDGTVMTLASDFGAYAGEDAIVEIDLGLYPDGSNAYSQIYFYNSFDGTFDSGAYPPDYYCQYCMVTFLATFTQVKITLMEETCNDNPTVVPCDEADVIDADCFNTCVEESGCVQIALDNSEDPQTFCEAVCGRSDEQFDALSEVDWPPGDESWQCDMNCGPDCDSCLYEETFGTCDCATSPDMCESYFQSVEAYCGIPCGDCPIDECPCQCNIPLNLCQDEEDEDCHCYDDCPDIINDCLELCGEVGEEGYDECVACCEDCPFDDTTTTTTTSTTTEAPSCDNCPYPEYCGECDCDTSEDNCESYQQCIENKCGFRCNECPEKPDCPEGCGCDGKVNYLKLRNNGESGHFKVKTKKNDHTLFEGYVNSGETFEVTCDVDVCDKWGTLGTEINFFYSESGDFKSWKCDCGSIHTSCSQPIWIGATYTVCGQEIEVIDGTSKNKDFCRADDETCDGDSGDHGHWAYSKNWNHGSRRLLTYGYHGKYNWWKGKDKDSSSHSHKWRDSEEDSNCPECVCDGKITYLKFKYTGYYCVDVEVRSTRKPSDKWARRLAEEGYELKDFFKMSHEKRLEVTRRLTGYGKTKDNDGILITQQRVCKWEMFEVNGAGLNIDKWDTLGTEIIVKVGSKVQQIHTSCSQDIYVGQEFPDINVKIVAGASRNNGPLCDSPTDKYGDCDEKDPSMAPTGSPSMSPTAPPNYPYECLPPCSQEYIECLTGCYGGEESAADGDHASDECLECCESARDFCRGIEPECEDLYYDPSESGTPQSTSQIFSGTSGALILTFVPLIIVGLIFAFVVKYWIRRRKDEAMQVQITRIEKYRQHEQQKRDSRDSIRYEEKRDSATLPPNVLENDDLSVVDEE